MNSINRKPIYLTLLMTFTLFLTACASSTATKTDKQDQIITVNSSVAKIGHTYLSNKDGQIVLRGSLERRFSGRNQIPGYLNISIADTSGKVINETDIGYMRRNTHSSLSRFYVNLPENLPKGFSVTVTHIKPVSQQAVQKTGIWR